MEFALSMTFDGDITIDLEDQQIVRKINNDLMIDESDLKGELASSATWIGRWGQIASDAESLVETRQDALDDITEALTIKYYAKAKELKAQGYAAPQIEKMVKAYVHLDGAYTEARDSLRRAQHNMRHAKTIYWSFKDRQKNLLELAYGRVREMADASEPSAVSEEAAPPVRHARHGRQPQTQTRRRRGEVGRQTQQEIDEFLETQDGTTGDAPDNEA